ncbi:hypothetical protein PPSIR1_11215 [Plesiocystis pacifica SIR-1]|uniref:DUF4157 domain-containing protein n=2 Tax=Plesiocystis pacifica TaxID=191768 RepID=A6G146_9BACT|nr:hypothetical protein PPSIR1_11215 [Plesiocystis pacifica SIR-1]
MQRQADADRGGGADATRERASLGISGSASAYPHLSTINAAFGERRVAPKAHLDGRARAANAALGSRGFSLDGHVAFASSTPSLFEATHEAVHELQRARGEQPEGGGRSGDRYEAQANEVALAVTEGRDVSRSLAPLGAAGASGGASEGGGSLQFLKEGETMEYVRNQKMRVANRRASVDATHGESYAKHRIFVGALVGRDEFLDPVRQAIKDAHDTVTTNADADRWMGQHALHINRYILEKIKAGTCRNFAEMTLSRHVETTQNQWVYVAGVEGYIANESGVGVSHYDHGWTLTSPVQLPLVRAGGLLGRGPLMLPNNLDAQVNVQDVTVMDPWDSHKIMSIDRFLRQGKNYYARNFRYGDIKIYNVVQSHGAQTHAGLFPQTLIRAIKNGAQAALRAEMRRKEYPSDRRTIYEDNKRSGLDKDNSQVWEFDRVKQTHVEHVDAARLWELTRGIPNARVQAAFDSWRVDANATIDWARQGSARAAFDYMVRRGGASRAAIYSCVDTTQALPAALTGDRLWKMAKHLSWRADDKVLELTTLVRNMSPQQLRELRREASNSNFTNHIVPKLSQTQRTALGL